LFAETAKGLWCWPLPGNDALDGTLLVDEEFAQVWAVCTSKLEDAQGESAPEVATAAREAEPESSRPAGQIRGAGIARLRNAFCSKIHLCQFCRQPIPVSPVR